MSDIAVKLAEPIALRARLNEDWLAVVIGLLVFGAALVSISGTDLLGWAVTTSIYSDVTKALSPFAMNSVRQYTSENVNKHVKPLLDQRSQFISETVPGYSARQVFEFFRKGKDYEDFLYKEATLNPTNPLNKADGFEASLVENFRRDPELA